MATPTICVQGDGSPRTFQLKCPTCKKVFMTTLPATIKDQGQGGLVNILVPHTSTPCGHAVQLFLDMNFRVRGYTRIDFINDETPESQDEKPVAGPAARASTMHKVEPLKMPEEDERLTRAVGDIIKRFATNVSEVEAIAVFNYEGYIIAKALKEEIRLEDISMLAAALMSQTSALGKSLNLRQLQDFTISSDKYKVTIIKNVELLLLVMYDKDIKEGLMRYNLKKLDADVRAAVTTHVGRCDPGT